MNHFTAAADTDLEHGKESNTNPSALGEGLWYGVHFLQRCKDCSNTVLEVLERDVGHDAGPKPRKSSQFFESLPVKTKDQSLEYSHRKLGGHIDKLQETVRLLDKWQTGLRQMSSVGAVSLLESGGYAVQYPKAIQEI